MGAMMLAMITWISAVSGLPMPDALPHVARLTEHEMTRRAAGGAGADPAVAGSYVALYHPESRTILLRTDWSAGDLRDRSILVHELVHHMQASAGVSYACRGAGERVAYEIQARWLAEQGADLFDVMGHNGLFFHTLTRC